MNLYNQDKRYVNEKNEYDVLFLLHRKFLLLQGDNFKIGQTLRFVQK